jgi:hypothetical protein
MDLVTEVERDKMGASFGDAAFIEVIVSLASAVEKKHSATVALTQEHLSQHPRKPLLPQQTQQGSPRNIE